MSQGHRPSVVRNALARTIARDAADGAFADACNDSTVLPCASAPKANHTPDSASPNARWIPAPLPRPRYTSAANFCATRSSTERDVAITALTPAANSASAWTCVEHALRKTSCSAHAADPEMRRDLRHPRQWRRRQSSEAAILPVPRGRRNEESRRGRDVRRAPGHHRVGRRILQHDDLAHTFARGALQRVYDLLAFFGKRAEKSLAAHLIRGRNENDRRAPAAQGGIVVHSVTSEHVRPANLRRAPRLSKLTNKYVRRPYRARMTARVLLLSCVASADPTREPLAPFADSPATAALAEALLSRYVIEREIGRGGMAAE